jgi:VCBS repeat-containing protein
MSKILFRWLAGFFLCLNATSALALQLNQTSGTNFYVDFSSDMRAAYVSYTVTNTDGVAYSNLWVTIDSFTNAVMKLGGGDAGQYAMGALANNQGKPVFFYLQVTNDPGTTPYKDRFTLKVYRGFPATGTLLTSSNFVITVNTSGQNQANKVTSLTYAPTNNPIVGGIVKISVVGTTGNVNVGNDLAFTPATFTNWNAGAFELVGCNIVVTDSPNYVLTNVLDATSVSHITGQGDTYEADYWFRAVGTTLSTTPVSPVNYLNNGGGSVNHVQESALLALPPVLPPTNMTVMTPLVSSTQLYTNEIVTLSLRFTNSSAVDVTIDRVVDTLPPGFLYVANSSTFNGAAILDPAASSQVFTWSQVYSVPAGSSRDFVFKAMPTTAGYATNSAIAYIKNTQIDTTLNTADNAPANEIVRALIVPTAVNDTGTTLEDTVLTVAAPGVLGNDAEPNTFSIAVISYTQPTNGSVTVNADGSYTYTPATNYNGADSFTYTMTNGNARASSATVTITVVAVNDPPTFTKGADQTVLEDAGAQSVANWATSISAGPANEAGQTVNFQVSNNNNGLFSAQPAVASNGTLTFMPAPNANGSATVTIYAQDNGGTANGGSDSSASQTFTITVTAVNDAPSFSKGGNQTVLEDAGPQSVFNWASGISAGPPDESGQTVTFRVSNDNSNLFSAQPNISSTGTLSYTPATNANGNATATVYLQDNGGTSNGGSDTSATQTFSISVTPVNDPPTLNPLSPVVLDEDSPEQTVALSGISAGPADESGQVLTVTATSSNPGLIPNPTVAYSSPDATGSLKFTPTTDSNGVAVVSVIVSDNGGTANGGVNSVTNTFTVTINALTTIWGPDGSLTRNIYDATGAPGTGYDELHITGNLDIQATSANPFTIQLASLPATNFDYDGSYIWTIATTTRGVDGFDSNKFIFDTSAFTNDLAGGTFAPGLSTDGKSVEVIFTPNHPPTAGPISYSRAHSTFLRLAIPDILTNYTADIDGDARAMAFVGSSTNGSYIATNGSYIVFAPTNNIPEAFTYVVKDARPYRVGDTIRMATNWITVAVTNAVGIAQSISVVNGQSVTVRFAGVPGYDYDVERTTNLISPTWVVVETTNAPANGVWLYQDTAPPLSGAYYRTKQH